MVAQQVLSPHGFTLQTEIAHSLMSAISIIVLAATNTRTERTKKDLRMQRRLLSGNDAV